MSAYEFDLIVIGVGSAGMVAGDVAPKIGARTALVERHRVGGDCLWTGCVPSKALIASARAAHNMRDAARFGLTPATPDVDTGAVLARVRRIQHEIADTDDNPKKFVDAGVEMVYGDARLLDAHTVAVGDRRLTAKFILLATGSRPADPNIPGLDDAGYLTSETLFEQERAPASMLIVGGGPIAIEMAQAHHRLGVRVTVLQRAQRILPKDEPSLSDRLLDVLRAEGMDIQLGVRIERAEAADGRKTLHGAVDGQPRSWSAEQVLVAAGRTPNVEGLGLDEAGIAHTPKGVTVDKNMRTTAESVYACGDVAGRYLFTHSAGAEAVAALRNMFYPLTKPAPDLIPWATFTEPELAHIGMTSDEAREKLGKSNTKVFRWDLSHNDRARAEAATEGAIVVVTDAKFKVVGAHILAPAAGEMIASWTMAIQNELRVTPDFGNLVQVYPTLSTAFSQLAAEATYGQLEKPFLRTLKRLNDRFG
jgi:pyruvate/2-oxoglutarate dehydrogenase complex dihydrolipoamide dehydrogenase (E3) component